MSFHRNSYRKARLNQAKATALLAASLSIGSALFPTAAAAGDSFPRPIDDMIGLPGESVTIRLDDYLGPGNGAYRVSSSGSSVQAVSRNGELSLYLNHPGMTTFTVTRNGSSLSDVFNVRVMDVGADKRYDIGDTVRFMKDNPGVITNKAAVNKLMTKYPGFQVPPGNQAPLARKDSHVFHHFAGSGSVPLSELFQDADGDELTYTVLFSSAANGLNASVSDNRLVLSGTPSGVTKLTVYAVDAHGAFAQVPVTVNPVQNQSPTVIHVTYSVYSALGQIPAALELTKLFHDPDNDTLTYTVTALTYGPTAAVSAASLSFNGVLTAAASYLISATDLKSAPVTSTLILDPFLNTGVNRQPSANEPVVRDYFVIGSKLSLDLRENFTDPDEDVLTFTVSSIVPNGLTATVSGNLLTIQGTPESLGTAARFSVTAKDAGLLTTTATYELKMNRKPTVTHNIYKLYHLQNTPIPPTEVDLTSNFTDPDSGDSLQFTLGSDSVIPSGFTASVVGSKLVYSGVTDNAVPILVVKANDLKRGTAQAAYAIIPNCAPVLTNPASVIHSVYYTQTPGSSLPEFDFAEQFYDPDTEDTLSYEVETVYANGLTPELNSSDFILSFTGHITDWSTPARFKLIARDNKDGSASAEYVIIPNHTPVFNMAGSYKVDNDDFYWPTGMPFDLSEAFRDADANDTLQYFVNVLPDAPKGSSWLSLTGDGTSKPMLRIASTSSILSGKIKISAADRNGEGRTSSHNVQFETTPLSMEPSIKVMLYGSQLTLTNLYTRYNTSTLTENTTFRIVSSDPSIVTAYMNGDDLMISASQAKSGFAQLLVIATDLTTNQGIIDQIPIVVSEAEVDAGAI